MKKRIIILMFFTLLCFSMLGFSNTVHAKAKFKYSYGVFLSLGPDQMNRMAKYKTIILDAQYFSKKQITKLKKKGHKIYTYINMGALENFRPYYKKFRSLGFLPYEGWKEERWVNVTSTRWQKHIASLGKSYAKKGVDGFFIDNCDVYYALRNKVSRNKLYASLKIMLRSLRTKYHKPVIINGGDTFVKRCQRAKLKLNRYFTAVNQENAFLSSDTRYYLNYLKKLPKSVKIYILEYTKNSKKRASIYAKCKKLHWTCYVSDSLELD